MATFDRPNPDSLFSLTLEIEGLLLLLARREEMAPDEVGPLLAQKCALLAQGLTELGFPVPDFSASIGAHNAPPEPKAETHIEDLLPSLPGLFDDEEIESTSVLASSKEVDSVDTSDDVSVPEDNDDQIAEAALFEAEEDADEEADADANANADADAVENAEEDTIKDAPADDNEDGNSNDDTPAEGTSTGSDLRHLFTLNDKFRFRRELFGNSDSRFVDALNLIAAMHDMDEVESYFYDDLDWDPDDDVVVEFMGVVAKHFE